MIGTGPYTRARNARHPINRLRPRSGYLDRYIANNDFVTTASSTALTVTATASATPHTKGTWTEAIASTSADVYGLELNLDNTFVSATDTASLLDVGVGASGSETVVVPNVQTGFANRAAATWTFPIFIRAGSRIAIRSQSVVASKTTTVYIRGLADRGLASPASYTYSYGADTATSHGTTLTDSGAQSVKGPWSELAAATDERLAAILISHGNGGDLSLQGTYTAVDVAIGAAGSESVVATNLYVSGQTNESFYPIAYRNVAVDIPAGVRLAVRYANNSGASSGVDVIVHGIPWRP